MARERRRKVAKQAICLYNEDIIKPENIPDLFLSTPFAKP
jgi:hypothetical protein